MEKVEDVDVFYTIKLLGGYALIFAAGCIFRFALSQ